MTDTASTTKSGNSPFIAPIAEADCVFCSRIRLGDYDEYQSVLGVAAVFEPISPVVPGHMLVISWKHLTHAAEAPMLAGQVFETAAQVAWATGGDFNLITSAGLAASQSVAHLHVHVVPRKPQDGLMLPWSDQAARRLPHHQCQHDRGFWPCLTRQDRAAIGEQIWKGVL